MQKLQPLALKSSSCADLGQSTSPGQSASPGQLSLEDGDANVVGSKPGAAHAVDEPMDVESKQYTDEDAGLDGSPQPKDAALIKRKEPHLTPFEEEIFASLKVRDKKSGQQPRPKKGLQQPRRQP